MSMNLRVKEYMKATGMTIEELALGMELSIQECRNFLDFNEEIYLEKLVRLAEVRPEMIAFVMRTPECACKHHAGVPGTELDKKK
jgi:hypothetical protein